MVATSLVDGKIRAGEKLVQGLDKAEFPFKAAFWFYVPESGIWHLMIATELVDSQGPRAVYGRVDDIMHDYLNGEDLYLREISVVSPKDSLIKALGKAVRTGRGISGIRMTRNSINNVYIEDAYIYRVE